MYYSRRKSWFSPKSLYLCEFLADPAHIYREIRANKSLAYLTISASYIFRSLSMIFSPKPDFFRLFGDFGAVPKIYVLSGA